jgi:hypothetical protein
MKPVELLEAWLVTRVPDAACTWLREAVARLRAGATERELYLLVSQVARRVGKAPLVLANDELAAAAGSRQGWDPRDWSTDNAARVLLLLASTQDGAEISRRLDRLCAAADIDELVAFYRGLPLYPDPPRHALRAAEGVRSNMRVVFEAVAHRNPYPAEQLPEDAWNQMVLKALFVGSLLAPIAGLDTRANATLARMLRDYAHERWSAGRPVSPELWRCVGPFAGGEVLADLARVLESGQPAERAAAVLALRSAPDPAARPLLDRHAALRDAVAARGANWTTVLEFN